MSSSPPWLLVHTRITLIVLELSNSARSSLGDTCHVGNFTRVFSHLEDLPRVVVAPRQWDRLAVRAGLHQGRLVCRGGGVVTREGPAAFNNHIKCFVIDLIIGKTE